MGVYGIANCGKKGNAETLEFLLNWVSPTGERLADRFGQEGKGENFKFLNLGSFASAETVQIALDAGGDPNEPTNMSGLGKGMCSVSRGLLSAGMGKDSFLVKALAAMDGQRPLHAAAANSNVGVVEKLLEVGADPRIRNKMGQTPLDIAEERGQARIAQMLRDELKHWPEPVPSEAYFCGAESLPEPSQLKRLRREVDKIKRPSKDSMASTTDGASSNGSNVAPDIWV
jgi:hypothetical protein